MVSSNSNHDDGTNPVTSLKIIDESDDKVVVETVKPRLSSRLKVWLSKPRNRLLIEILLGVFIIILVGLTLWRWNRNNAIYSSQDTTRSTSAIKTDTPQETAVSILDGTLVPKDLANRHPLGVMIENHVDARPQSGLSAASLVYEAIAEGGITRYLAIYSGYNAAKIGPIRSARTYYVNLAKGFNAYLAHVGGNYDALQLIPSIGVLDLDQFANAVAYWRDTSKKVSSEHTVYSSTDRLYSLAQKKGFTADNTFTPFVFKTDATEALRPASQKVIVEFGSSQYTDTFSFDPKTNTYLRSIGNLPDQDLETGKRIAPKNLILEEVIRTATTTIINEKGYIFNLDAGGKATIFQDGKQVIGTWKHPKNTDRTFYYDASGNEIKLNPGQTWVCLTHADIKVTVE